jgi:hypothetical protein
VLKVASRALCRWILKICLLRFQFIHDLSGNRVGAMAFVSGGESGGGAGEATRINREWAIVRLSTSDRLRQPDQSSGKHGLVVQKADQLIEATTTLLNVIEFNAARELQ